MVIMLVLTACPASDGDGAGASPGGGGGESPEGDGTIVVTFLWGGAEGEAFEKVLAAFEESSGITVESEPNRTEYESVLRTRIQGGNPPDVAIIPSAAFLRQLAAEGSIISLADLGIELSEIEGQFPPGVLDLGQVDGEQFAFLTKMNSKACIFYSPERFTEMGVEPAEDWDGLLQLTEDIKATGATPWALGAGDSWTLTDAFEIIYLKLNGAEAYDTLFSAEGDWTDPSVQVAIDKMLEIYTDENVDGGIDGSLSTLFVDGIAKVFGTSPSAELYYEASAVGGIATGVDVNPDLAGQEGTAIDWFPFPTIDGAGEGLITYGGDQMGALVNDTDVVAFFEYMLSVESAEVWAAEGTVIVPNTNASPDLYPNVIMQKDAELINSAEAVRFDGGDLLPGGDLGAVLQSALRGEDMGPVLEEFQAAVTTAWESQ
jgi:ABC-type glycerol-3-phosphate transport system substrate-binding protein